MRGPSDSRRTEIVALVVVVLLFAGAFWLAETIRRADPFEKCIAALGLQNCMRNINELPPGEPPARAERLAREPRDRD